MKNYPSIKSMINMPKKGQQITFQTLHNTRSDLLRLKRNLQAKKLTAENTPDEQQLNSLIKAINKQMDTSLGKDDPMLGMYRTIDDEAKSFYEDYNRFIGQLVQKNGGRLNFGYEDIFLTTFKTGKTQQSRIDDVFDVLKERVGKKTAYNVIDGIFTPLSISEGALEGRFDSIKRGNPDEIFFKSDFVPRRQLKNAKNKWDGLKFEDYERELREPKSSDKIPEATIETQQTSQAPQVPPLPDTPQPTVSPVSMVNKPSNRTGLTDAESVYLGPTEQLYRRRERGIT